jgi:hypothetical protein
VALGQTGAGGVVVMGSRGGWRSAQGEVKHWSRLSAGAVIETPTEGGEIYVICPKSGAVTHRCTRPPCKIPVCTGPGVASGDVKAQGTSIWDYFLKRPSPGVMAGVRGGINEPQEAVLRLEGAMLDLTPSLEKVFEGEYCLLLSPVTAPQTARPLRVRWRPGMAPAEGMRPGLYLLHKATAACERTDAEPAWVMVAAAADHARWGPEFTRTQAQLESLEQRGFGAPASLAILRAMLATYAESAGK